MHVSVDAVIRTIIRGEGSVRVLMLLELSADHIFLRGEMVVV